MGGIWRGSRLDIPHPHDSPHSPHIPRQVKERIYHQKRLQAEALAEAKVGVEEDPVQVGVDCGGSVEDHDM